MNEKYKEIQDYIDIIITTARLLGYNIGQSDYGHYTSCTLRYNRKTISIFHYNVSNRIKIIRNSKIIVQAGEGLSQKEKIMSLKNILQNL